MSSLLSQPSSHSYHFSVKPFQPSLINSTKPSSTSLVAASPQAAAPWLGRSIATTKLRLLEHSAFVEIQRDHDSYHKHLFVHIGGHTDYSDSLLEVR